MLQDNGTQREDSTKCVTVREQGSSMGYLNSMLQKSQILLEASKPGCNAWGNTSEVVLPQAPGSGVEYFYKEGIGPIRLRVVE